MGDREEARPEAVDLKAFARTTCEVLPLMSVMIDGKYVGKDHLRPIVLCPVCVLGHIPLSSLELVRRTTAFVWRYNEPKVWAMRRIVRPETSSPIALLPEDRARWCVDTKERERGRGRGREEGGVQAGAVQAGGVEVGGGWGPARAKNRESMAHLLKAFAPTSLRQAPPG